MAAKTSKLKLVTLVKAVVAYAKIVRDPNQLGEVFALADSLSEPKVMDRLASAFRQDPMGAQALIDRKRVRVDLAALERLPEGTLGRTYASFMRSNGLTPDALPSLEGATEHEYIRAHLYETHDMWHAMTGFKADVAGELGLQGFYAAQVDGPLATAILAAGLLNTALFAIEERFERLDAITRGWEAGRRAKPLFGFDFAAAWARPVAEVRASMGIDPAGYGSANPAQERPRRANVTPLDRGYATSDASA